MEDFIGSWKFVHGEGYEKYLRATGAGDEIIAIANVLHPVVTISNEDDIVEIKLHSSMGTEDISFRLGEEFYNEKLDGRYCKTVVDLRHNQLIQVEKWDNKHAVSTIEVHDGKLIKKITFKDITAVQTFEKI